MWSAQVTQWQSEPWVDKSCFAPFHQPMLLILGLGVPARKVTLSVVASELCETWAPLFFHGCAPELEQHYLTRKLLAEDGVVEEGTESEN